MHTRIAAAALVVSVGWTLDWISKAVARAELEHVVAVAVLPGLNLTLLYNPGVSFGLLPVGTQAGLSMMLGMQTLMTVIVAGLAWRSRNEPSLWAWLLLLSGALGNLQDRATHGAVTDFIDLYAGSYHWPAFNLADVFISAGVIGLFARELMAWFLGKGFGKRRMS